MLLHKLVKLALPILIRKLTYHFPALDKLDKILKYVEDDNELDIEFRKLLDKNKMQQVEIVGLK